MVKASLTYESFDELLDSGLIPAEVDTNVFFSCHHVKNTTPGDNSRPMDFGSILFWDIDHASRYRALEYSQVIADTLQVGQHELTTVWSGGGVHVYLKVNKYSEEDLENYRPNYSAALEIMKERSKNIDLPGQWDFLFDKGRVFRLPNTWNAKREPKVKCEVLEKWVAGTLPKDLQFILDPFKNKALVISQGLENIKNIDPNIKGELSVIEQGSGVKRIFPENDLSFVVKNCPFLVHCRENPTEIIEPQWYAALGAIAFNETTGDAFAHDISKGHPNYSERATTKKLDQVRENQTGPTTCEQIALHWAGCQSCPHFGKITTPYQLVAPDVIPSEASGFWHLEVSKSGAVDRTPDYFGLMKKRELTTPTKYNADQERFYEYNGTFYAATPDTMIEKWCYKTMDPQPSPQITTNFKRYLTIHTAEKSEDMKAEFKRKINLANGILDLEKMQLTPHTPKDFSTYSIPVPYDPAATCELFNSWLLERLSGDQELFEAIMDFYAYALAGVPVTNRKLLILFGQGRDGKSTLIETMAHIFGDQNIAYTDKNSLASDFGTAQLHGKRLAIMEEMPAGSDRQLWEKIKGLVGGTKATFNQKYEVPFIDDFYARFVMSCNKLPSATDQTFGLHDRFLIIPFHAPIVKIDPYMSMKLRKESSGILNNLIERIKRLEPNGFVITNPKASEEELEEYKIDQSPFRQWLEFAVKLDPQSTVSGNSAFGSYQDFCADSGIKTLLLTRRGFFKQIAIMANNGPEFKIEIIRYDNKTIKDIKGIKILGQK